MSSSENNSKLSSDRSNSVSVVYLLKVDMLFSESAVAPVFSNFVLVCGGCVGWAMRGICRATPLGIGVVLALLLRFLSRYFDVST